jgi:uncharacterized membrane protein
MALTPKNIFLLIYIFAILGLLTSSYLLYTQYQEKALGNVCIVGEPNSCSTVTSSPYSSIFGIPASFWGITWFLVLGLLNYFASKKDKYVKHLISWNILGLVFVGYFIFAEFLLKSICSFCTIVHLLVLLSLIFSLYLKKKSDVLA